MVNDNINDDVCIESLLREQEMLLNYLSVITMLLMMEYWIMYSQFDVFCLHWQMTLECK
jgi:hypothetical protein